jgi:hypothetical protein
MAAASQIIITKALLEMSQFTGAPTAIVTIGTMGSIINMVADVFHEVRSVQCCRRTSMSPINIVSQITSGMRKSALRQALYANKNVMTAKINGPLYRTSRRYLKKNPQSPP